MKISKFTIFIGILMIFIVVGIGTVSASNISDIDGTINGNEDITVNYEINSDDNLDTSSKNSKINPQGMGLFSNSESIIINDTSYSSYFHNNGTIKSGINSGDTLDIQGTLDNKNFVVDIPLNFISSTENGKLLNGTIYLKNGGSKSNITGLTIINTNDGGHGIYLLESHNNTISNCNFTIKEGYSLAMVRSYYNKIIGNTMMNLLNTFTAGMDPSAKSVILLGDSHYNIIADNTLASNGSNCIYFSTFGFLDYGGGAISTYNNVTNNTITGGTVSWCYEIQIMGNYNNILNNTIYKGYRGISSVGSFNNVIGNKIHDSVTGIYAGTNNIISNNYINQTGSHIGIVVTGSNTIVKNNEIYVINGKAIDVSSRTNVTIEENNISSSAGTGIYIFGNSSQIYILRNIINSSSGLCISIKRQDSRTFPSNITISNNTLRTGGNYSIDAKDCDVDSFIPPIDDNIITGNIIYPGGIIVEPIITFDGDTYSINPSNFWDYFDINGNLNSSINDGDILNFSGDFSNIYTSFDFLITSTIKITGNLATLYNSSFIITSRGAWIENLNIINENKIPFIIKNTEYITIHNNVVNMTHNTMAYGVYIYHSDNNVISFNNISTNGDLYSYGILLFGSLNNTINNNRIFVNGTHELHDYDTGLCICIDGEHIVNEIFRTYGILVLYSSDNNISDNTINVTSGIENPPTQSDNSTNSIAGIDIYFNSHNNIVKGNEIYINAKDPYIYGMGVLGGETNSGEETAKNNTFEYNSIEIHGSYFVTGFISGYNSLNTIVSNNTIFCFADTYAYGVTLETSQFNKVYDNYIDLSALVNYGMELYISNDNEIIDNDIKAKGNYSYGIATLASSRNIISRNIISVYGDALEQPTQNAHGDSIPFGNGGILLTYNSNNNTISDNNINSSGEYAIYGNDTQNTRITGNFLNATGIDISSPEYVEGKKGNESVFVVTTNESGNILIGNYINFFDEGDLSFLEANTTVNNSVVIKISVSNNLAEFENANVTFYVYYNNEWIRIGIGTIKNGHIEYNWTKIYDAMVPEAYEIKALIQKDNYGNLTINSNLNVGKADINVEILNSSGIKGEYATVSAKVTDSRGLPVFNITVSFYVNGSLVGRAYTNSEGIAILDYTLSPSQDIANLTLRASAMESSNYLAKSVVGTLVIKNKVYLTLNTTITSYGETAIVKFTVKGADGKVLGGKIVYLVVDGFILYQNTTNSNGIAQFNIPNLSKGNHSVLGYFAGDEFSYGPAADQGVQIIKDPEKADLIITNVKKSGNNYKVTIKNQGSGESSSAKLKVWYSKTKYKIVIVGSIAPGKSATVTVKFFKYSTHKKYKKYAEINYNKAIVESDYSNNKVTFKNSNYQRYKPDLIISSIKRSGNKYKIKITNKGSANSGKLKLKVWFGKGKSKKSKIYTIKNIEKGKYITATFKFFKYSQHKKYVKYAEINYNKAVIESNYKNNIKKFKI